MRVIFLGAPPTYAALLGPLLAECTQLARPGANMDLVHLFVHSEKELVRQLPALQKKLQPAGMLWVSWPKKSSGVSTDVTEDTVRRVALPLGLVDVKVMAVDEVWSALKLVIRRELRPGSS